MTVVTRRRARDRARGGERRAGDGTVTPMLVATRRRACAAVLGALVLAAACDGDDAAPPPTTGMTATTPAPAQRTTDGVLTIGVLLPATGEGAALGAPMRSAVADTVVDINAAGGVLGSSVRLVEFDEAQGGGGVESLIADGADAIVGPASSLVALAELHVAVEERVVVCSPTASALALDAYPHDGFFFRTVPSDSLQMEMIAIRVRDTGEGRVAVAYLDDPYGRGLADAFAARVDASSVLTLSQRAPFSGDQADLSEVAEAIAGDRVIVVLADSDDGGRLLTALDAVIDRSDPPTVIVNDAVSGARQSIAQLSPELRSRLVAVAPRASNPEAGVDGAFAAHAIDCVNLIALAVASAGTDRPEVFRREMAAISYGGSPCTSFAECAARLTEVPQIDYQGLSGSVDLRGANNELAQAYFQVFGFDDDGSAVVPTSRSVQRLP